MGRVGVAFWLIWVLSVCHNGTFCPEKCNVGLYHFGTIVGKPLRLM